MLIYDIVMVGDAVWRVYGNAVGEKRGKGISYSFTSSVYGLGGVSQRDIDSPRGGIQREKTIGLNGLLKLEGMDWGVCTVVSFLL